MCETFLLKRTPSEYLVETEGAGLENESNRALCKKEKKKKKKTQSSRISAGSVLIMISPDNAALIF